MGVLEGALVDVTKGSGSKLSVNVGEDVGLAAAWKITGRIHAANSIHSHKCLQKKALVGCPNLKNDYAHAILGKAIGAGKPREVQCPKDYGK